MTKNTKFARLPLIAVAALPLTVGLVFAQTTGATTAQTPQRVQPLQPGQTQNRQNQNQSNAPRQQSGTNYSDVFIQKLATQLGISVDKLKAAALSASKSTIDQGVKAGDFPSDMAQNMTQRLQDNPFAFAGGRGGRDHGGMRGDDMGGRGGDFGGRDGNFQGGPNAQGNQQGAPGQQGDRMGGPRGGFGQVISAAVAKTLGLTEQQLFTQLQGGQTIAQLAQSKGVSTAAIHNAAVTALKTQLAADVKAGRLSQAQADQMLQQAQADANFGLNFGRGGRGGDRGDTNQQTTPNQNG